jgi:hypothetical protein
MKKMLNLCLCVSLCTLLGACVGHHGVYTGGRHHNNTNTALAVGTAALVGSSLYRAGRHDVRRNVYHPRPPVRYVPYRRVYREAPVVRYVPPRRVYRDGPRVRYAPHPRVYRRGYYR